MTTRPEADAGAGPVSAVTARSPARGPGRGVIYSVTLILAFCSIVYELLLAQTLASVMGNSQLRYNITIGLYIFALGAGAMIYERWKPGASMSRLVNVEIVLCLVGAFSPLSILLFDTGMHYLAHGLDISYRHGAIQTMIYVFNHGMIIAIGILSGLELPLLMNISEQNETSGGIRALAVDYGGTLVGAVAFPLLILPALGVLFTAFLVGLLNAICALWLLAHVGTGTSWSSDSRESLSRLATGRGLLCAFAAMAFLVFLFYNDSIREFTLENFYFNLPSVY